MPNIEIHGMGNVGSDTSDTRSKIRKAMDGVNYGEDIVITTVLDFTEDLEGNPKPFLRVIFARNDPAGIYDDCLGRLVALNMDIEVTVIRTFIQKMTG